MKYIDNQWYQVIDENDDGEHWYVKGYINNNRLDVWKEHIIDSAKYYNYECRLGEIGHYNYKDIDVSIIRHLLPEGHIDKLPQEIQYEIY